MEKAVNEDRKAGELKEAERKLLLHRVIQVDDAGAEQDVLHHPERTVQIPVQGDGGTEQLRDRRCVRVVGREPGVVQQRTCLRRRIAHGIVQDKRDEIDEEKRHHEAKIARQQLRQQMLRPRPLERREITGQDTETIQREARIQQHRQRVRKQPLELRPKRRPRITQRPEHPRQMRPENHQTENIF